MNHSTLLAKANKINGDIRSFDVNSDIDLSSEIDKLSVAWNTEHGQEVVKELREEVERLNNLVAQMRRLCNSVHSQRISVVTSETE